MILGQVYAFYHGKLIFMLHLVDSEVSLIFTDKILDGTEY